MDDDRDWRLEAELRGSRPSGGLDQLVDRIRGRDEVRDDVQAAVSDDVVITHDGRRLFAYAASQSALATARRAIEDAVRRDGYEAEITISHWDYDLDDWHQGEPRPSAAQARAEDAAVRQADEMQTRTLICTAGKLVRETLEQSMSQRASELGVECKIVDHPHLLTTQVAFRITGPRRKLDEFQDGLQAEELQTIRADWAVMNPL